MTDIITIKRWYLLCFAILFTIIIVILSSSGISSSDPLITSISPDFYINGFSKEVTIKGSGFDPITEVFIFGGGPYIVESQYTPGEAWDVAIDGNYAFVVDSNSGLQVIDI